MNVKVWPMSGAVRESKDGVVSKVVRRKVEVPVVTSGEVRAENDELWMLRMRGDI